MSGILLKITERGRGRRRGRNVKEERRVRERDRKCRKILIFDIC